MSKRAEFTPGPWMVDEGHFDDVSVLMGSAIDDPDCYYTAHRWFCEVEQHEGDEEALANARLIAAAPCLLDVCQRLLEAVPYVSEYDVPLGLWDDLRAAIAKATGADHER